MKNTLRCTLSVLLFFAAGDDACAQGCVGCTPLNDLGAGLYLGQFEGGLYAGGVNEPPPAHALAAQTQAKQIVPRSASGAPDPDGWIGMVSFTMSNANQEFSAYERRADLDTQRNARVRIVNLAQGGQALDRIKNPNAQYWSNVDERVTAAGMSPEQVQVAWLKMADSQPLTTFPAHAQSTLANARAVLQILKGRYPNLRLAYFSSRIYGGYSSNPLRGEPLSYETGFAVKWLIEAQIAGDPGLNYDPAQGPVVSPLILWGPYLWANGMTPRSDGLVWLPEDFETDNIHPSALGEQKVADMLEAFFKNDPSAVPWFDAKSGFSLVTLDAVADANVDVNQPNSNFGTHPQLRIEGPGRDAYVKFDLSGVQGRVKAAKLSLVTPPMTQSDRGTEGRGVSDSSWTELGITYASAPVIDGSLHGRLPVLSRGTATSIDVTADVAGATGEVSFGLVSAPGLPDPKRYISKEGGEAPRLVLTLGPRVPEPQTYCTAKTNSCGTLPALSFSGTSSASASSGFGILGSNANFAKAGLVLYGRNGRNSAPFNGGVLCVGTPLRRSAVQFSSGGNAGSCDSQLALDVNAFASGALGGNPAAFLSAIGQSVNVQWWARDTIANGSYLSDGGEYAVGP